jgi:hypothetical protein
VVARNRYGVNIGGVQCADGNIFASHPQQAVIVKSEHRTIALGMNIRFQKPKPLLGGIGKRRHGVFRRAAITATMGKGQNAIMVEIRKFRIWTHVKT